MDKGQPRNFTCPETEELCCDPRCKRDSLCAIREDQRAPIKRTVGLRKPANYIPKDRPRKIARDWLRSAAQKQGRHLSKAELEQAVNQALAHPSIGPSIRSEAERQIVSEIGSEREFAARPLSPELKEDISRLLAKR
jgi:hypothetical protein